MYKKTYECRLCKEIVEIPVSRDEAISMTRNVIGNDPFAPTEEYHLIHKCANGSKGVMDLLGFRFYGEK